MLAQVLKAIGAFVVAGGGLAVIVFALFKTLGEKWLDAKFGERLAAYKHEQQKELEQLRFKINAMLDRATKLHQREFDVLPEAWAKLNDAFWQTLAFVSPLQMYPDLNRMSAVALEEFLADCPLKQWQKDELKAEKDRTGYYMKRIVWHRLAAVKAVARDSHIYLLKNGIFLSSDLREGFVAFDDMVWAALDECALNESHDDLPRESEKATTLRNDGAGVLKKLETAVRERLWNSQDIAV